MAGGLSAKLLNIWFSGQLTVEIILACAIAWEVFEYFVDVKKLPQNHLYKENFFLDACGDIIGAVMMAIIVVF